MGREIRIEALLSQTPAQGSAQEVHPVMFFQGYSGSEIGQVICNECNRCNLELNLLVILIIDKSSYLCVIETGPKWV